MEKDKLAIKVCNTK